MKDLTFVIQGSIHKHTKYFLESIRYFYPDSKVILSTWEGESEDGLSFDVLIKSQDPGAVEHAPKQVNNVNRQIRSTLAGLKAVQTTFAVKMRTDTQILERNLPRLLETLPEGQLFSRKIIALNLFFRDPRKYPLLFHIGDIFQVGRTEDLIDLWDIPLAPEPETSLWQERHGAYSLFNDWPQYNPRYVPEQYIFIAFLHKHNIDVRLKYCRELDWRKACLSEELIAKNFQVFTFDELGISIPPRLLLLMDPESVYQQATLDDYSTERAERLYKGMIRRRKWRMIRRFIKSPRRWLDPIKNSFWIRIRPR